MTEDTTITLAEAKARMQRASRKREVAIAVERAASRRVEALDDALREWNEVYRLRRLMRWSDDETQVSLRARAKESADRAEAHEARAETFSTAAS